MNNYHVDLIWVIDEILLGIVIILGLIIIVYSLVKEYRWRRRSGALLNIKKNIYELVLSGKNSDINTCLPEISGITEQQFLDVATNRNRETTFFNESEQEALKGCFVSAERIAAVEKTAIFSWRKWRRVEAILTLGYAQDAASLSTLKKTIYERDPDISYFSIIALGQMKNPASAKILLGFVKERFLYPYRIFSILEVFPSEISEEVICLTESPLPQVRAWSIALISKLGVWQYHKKIEEFTKDESAQVRASACDCLAEFGRKESGGVIIKCFTDDSWLVRVSAVKALFKVWGEESLPEIMEMLNDGSLSVIESIKVLVTENIETCIPYIEELLLGTDEMSKRVSIEALESSGYIVKLFKNILTGSPKDKTKAESLIKSLINAFAYAGLEGSLLSFPGEERGRLLDIIRNIDEPAAMVLEQSIKEREG